MDKFCPKCSKRYARNDDFCSRCGKERNWEDDDYDDDYDEDSDSAIDYPYTTRRGTPFRTIPCDVCKGSGRMSFIFKCEDCNGRGYNFDFKE